MQNFKLPAQSNNEVIDTSIKRYPENMYTFAMWPTTGNVYRISGYLLIWDFLLTLLFVLFDQASETVGFFRLSMNSKLLFQSCHCSLDFILVRVQKLVEKQIG